MPISLRTLALVAEGSSLGFIIKKNKYQQLNAFKENQILGSKVIFKLFTLAKKSLN
jgi:hypothetical protein